MADWSAAGDFEKAAKPGDLVDEEIVEEFVNCLPPTTLRGDLVQAGEPYFGRLKMCNITAQQIITWQNEMLNHIHTHCLPVSKTTETALVPLRKIN